MASIIRTTSAKLLSRASSFKFSRTNSKINYFDKTGVPDELLKHIFGFVNDARTILSISETCKKWNHIIKERIPDVNLSLFFSKGIETKKLVSTIGKKLLSKNSYKPMALNSTGDLVLLGLQNGRSYKIILCEGGEISRIQDGQGTLKKLIFLGKDAFGIVSKDNNQIRNPDEYLSVKTISDGKTLVKETITYEEALSVDQVAFSHYLGVQETVFIHSKTDFIYSNNTELVYHRDIYQNSSFPERVQCSSTILHFSLSQIDKKVAVLTSDLLLEVFELPALKKCFSSTLCSENLGTLVLTPYSLTFSDNTFYASYHDRDECYQRDQITVFKIKDKKTLENSEPIKLSPNGEVAQLQNMGSILFIFRKSVIDVYEAKQNTFLASCKVKDLKIAKASRSGIYWIDSECSLHKIAFKK